MFNSSKKTTGSYVNYLAGALTPCVLSNGVLQDTVIQNDPAISFLDPSIQAYPEPVNLIQDSQVEKPQDTCLHSIK